jgi:hypothetical protein
VSQRPGIDETEHVAAQRRNRFVRQRHRPVHEQRHTNAAAGERCMEVVPQAHRHDHVHVMPARELRERARERAIEPALRLALEHRGGPGAEARCQPPGCRIDDVLREPQAIEQALHLALDARDPGRTSVDGGVAQHIQDAKGRGRTGRRRIRTALLVARVHAFPGKIGHEGRSSPRTTGSLRSRAL